MPVSFWKASPRAPITFSIEVEPSVATEPVVLLLPPVVPTTTLPVLLVESFTSASSAMRAFTVKVLPSENVTTLLPPAAVDSETEHLIQEAIDRLIACIAKNIEEYVSRR